jgi:energy-converting hydrogenase Eha subunit G
MNDSFEAYAVAVIVVFGAVTIGGLMAAAIAFGERDGFFFSLGAGAAAWAAGYAIFFDRPRAYIVCLSIAVLMAIAATLTIAF